MKFIGRIISILIISTILISYNSPKVIAAPVNNRETYQVFLPLISNMTSNKIALGVYTLGYLGQQSTIDNEVKAIETWSGEPISIVGTFIAIEDLYPDYNIPVPLGLIWDNGYVPFVNLDTSHTLTQINNGQADAEIRKMADAFVTWRNNGLAKGQNRKAFVAPLQEMNGDWVSYHGTPQDFKTAYDRIRTIFDQRGASPSVSWVFAPNGWSDVDEPPFEDYYPGNDKVDAVAFSSYNSGYCPNAAWKAWDDSEKVFSSYISRMNQMTSGKPIFIAQTATTAYNALNQSSDTAKNNWLNETYNLLARSQNVRGIIYFNRDKECDWAFYQKDGRKMSGYIQGVSLPNYDYLAPTELFK